MRERQQSRGRRRLASEGQYSTHQASHQHVGSRRQQGRRKHKRTHTNTHSHTRSQLLSRNACATNSLLIVSVHRRRVCVACVPRRSGPEEAPAARSEPGRTFLCSATALPVPARPAVVTPTGSETALRTCSSADKLRNHRLLFCCFLSTELTTMQENENHFLKARWSYLGSLDTREKKQTEC